jgi:hypothetical protein
MNTKKIIQVVVILFSLCFSAAVLFMSQGFGLTPLTKLFIVFFGIIVGFQAVPAILMFLSMVKGIFGRGKTSALKQGWR